LHDAIVCPEIIAHTSLIAEYELADKKCTWVLNKGNKKITEHRVIFQRERQNSYVNKQTKSVNNRKNGRTAMALTWYRHFQRNGGLNQILRRQSSRFHYGVMVPVVTITGFLTILRQNRFNNSQRSIL
jgi:hypothetical protein